MYRDARAEHESLAGKDPFLDLQWSKAHRDPPEPFTAEQQKKILDYFAEREPYYYAFVRFQFDTGCRPSESTAITWADLNAEERTIRVHRSRHLGAEADTKTTKSRRIIRVSPEILSSSCRTCITHGKRGVTRCSSPRRELRSTRDQSGPRITGSRVLDGLEIPRLKFYATPSHLHHGDGKSRRQSKRARRLCRHFGAG